MQIIDKTMSGTIEFHNINIGDVFYYKQSNAVYMKTETVYDNNKNIMANAVNLRIGSMYIFLPEYKVTPLKYECVITCQ